MPKIAPELSDIAVRRLTHGVVQGLRESNKDVGEPRTAYHAVGGVAGLLLQCRPPAPDSQLGAKSWILRVVVGTKRRDIGLGGYPEVRLSEARDKARAMKELVRQGIDPLIEKRAQKSGLLARQSKAITFEQIADEYIQKKGKEFKTFKQKQKLENQLKAYAIPVVGKMLVSDIERAHVVEILEPIWETKSETANRVRQSVERILDLARVKGLRSGDNPARWKGNLDMTFPARNKVSKVEHYAALPLKDMGEFMEKLRSQEWMGAKALHFLILTAARSGEVRGALWEEINEDSREWVIPKDRMKASREHRVPLCEDALKLLRLMPKTSTYVFPSTTGKPLTDVTISKVPKRLGYDVTAHGFRSVFKTWSQEHTTFRDEVSELALAHVSSDATRAAYARADLFVERRKLLEEWQSFCRKGLSPNAADV